MFVWLRHVFGIQTEQEVWDEIDGWDMLRPVSRPHDRDTLEWPKPGHTLIEQMKAVRKVQVTK